MNQKYITTREQSTTTLLSLVLSRKLMYFNLSLVLTTAASFYSTISYFNIHMCCHMSSTMSSCLFQEDPMKKRDHLSCFCSCMHHYQYMPVEWDTNYRDLPQEG